MNTLVIWIWAFWFAILNHISKNNPEKKFYWYEKDNFILENLKSKRENPYFFSWTKLEKNVYFLENLEKLNEFDLIIIAIPAQFVWNFIDDIKSSLKHWVIILNLSKWINNKNLKTTSSILKEKLWDFNYNYAILSGWMIAQELVNQKILWATIWTLTPEIWIKLKDIFESDNLKINLEKSHINTELFWSIKNIFALYMWYLEWSWLGMSSIWYHFCELYKELPRLLKLLSWDENIDFSNFALGWDLIATCFWESRNRYFWKLVWNWKTSTEAEKILKQEKKHAEWYYTLLWIKEIVLKSDLENFKKVVDIFIV